MAKCVACRATWKLNTTDLDDTSFITDSPKVGESVLNQRLDEIHKLVREIGKNYFKLRDSYRQDDDESEHIDCYEIQDDIINKLEKLLTEVPSVIEHIKDSNLRNVNKHRYFLHFSKGVISELKQLLVVVCRLNDLNSKIYIEEQRKSFISEESMTIHSLIEIWSASIEIMICFREQAELFFREQFESDEYNFMKESDFYIVSIQYAKIFLMDLTIASWLQFNRLVKYDDYLKGLIFLCPCNTKTYLRTLSIILEANEDDFFVDMLSLFIDNDKKSSMITTSIREMNIIPMIPSYENTDPRFLAYFQIWHLCSLLRIIKEEKNLETLSKCDTIIQSAFDVTMEQFKPINSSNEFMLSPNQEEKFKLVFAMIDKWCDTYKKSVKIITKAFSFFVENWNLYGPKYFDNDKYRIEGLTISQLFTKLVYQAIPISVDQDGHAVSENRVLSIDERKLDETWSKLLDKAGSQIAAPSTSKTVISSKH